MFTLRPKVDEDIPATLTLWQGLAGIGLRDADSPEVRERLELVIVSLITGDNPNA
jgi:hypothetical protein